MSPFDLLSLGHAVETVIVGGAGIAAFAAVYALWWGLLARDPMQARLRALARYRDGMRAELAAPRGHHFRQQRTVGAMRRAVDRLRLLRGKHAQDLSLRLARAGWRSTDAAVIFLFAKLCLPFAAGAGVLVLTSGFGMAESGSAKSLWGVFGVLIGAYGPEIVVRNATERRRKAIQKGLPDGLDLLVICAEAGLSLDGALQRVARETARACPPLADELGLLAVELGFLPERRKALDNLAARVDLPSIRGVVNTLAQTERYGTPLAQSLRVLAAEFRNERMMKAEEKAARLPAVLTVPLIVFILPTLFVVLLGPAILKAIDGMSGVSMR